MVDFDRIPKPIYDELVSLVGQKKAEAYIIKSNYNYSTINWGIRAFYLRRFFNKCHTMRFGYWNLYLIFGVTLCIVGRYGGISNIIFSYVLLIIAIPMCLYGLYLFSKNKWN